MAEYLLYKCKKCGWEIESPSEGADFLMCGGLSYFVCKDCKHVFGNSFEFGHEDEMSKKCPKCSSVNITDWKPNDNCPKCGGELENNGVTCLMD